jgi:hypothetical protein
MFGSNYNSHRASLGYSVRSAEEADRAFYGRAWWSMKLAILPHRCSITKKIIWLQYAYCGIAMWTGPGDNAVEIRWHDRHEHLIWVLKGPYGR